MMNAIEDVMQCYENLCEHEKMQCAASPDSVVIQCVPMRCAVLPRRLVHLSLPFRYRLSDIR